MAGNLIDWFDWRLTRDREGYRTYKVKWLIETDDDDDGPATVLATSGLPIIGATYGFGNEADLYVWCTPETTISPVRIREPNILWELEQTFTNKPMKRCNTDSIEDPLDEPQKISGSFVTYLRKARQDRNGAYLLSSSHELITDIEMDDSRATVVIEQNVSAHGIATFSALLNYVNDDVLWGLAARKVKFSRASFERKLYGTCSYYFTRKFEFDIRFDTFDLADVADTGYKVFNTDIADTAPNRANPKNYVFYKDDKGDNTPTKILLDGNGNALTDPTSPVFLDTIELYPEGDLTTLGIPTTF